MQKQKTLQLIKSLVASLILATTLGGLVQPSALAVVSDPTTISRLLQQKRSLLVRETELLRDRAELNKQIDDLRKRGNSDSARELNSLCQALDANNSDLRQTQFDIRDISRRLM